MGIKDKIKENPIKYNFAFSLYNKILGGNKFQISKNTDMVIVSSLLKHNKIIVNGNNNIIRINALTRMSDSTIYINGNNNKLVIDEENGFEGCNIWIEDDNNEIIIGRHNRFFKGSHLAALEGKKIHIGEDGLFATNVQVRTSDSHSITDMEGKRVNIANDVSIGNHVWIATDSVVLKGSNVPNNCVVGTMSLVNRQFEEENCVYAGNPAKKVKENTNWDSKRI